ncbi:hypothetical protein DSO57_1021662, partial [Entomophthora muscae]
RNTRPTQEEDKKGENNSEVALTQPVQVAQGARAQSINPKVPKLIQKTPTTKTVNDIFTKRVSLVYDPIYCCDVFLETLLEKVKPMLDTMCCVLRLGTDTQRGILTLGLDSY